MFVIQPAALGAAGKFADVEPRRRIGGDGELAHVAAAEAGDSSPAQADLSRGFRLRDAGREQAAEVVNLGGGGRFHGRSPAR